VINESAKIRDEKFSPLDAIALPVIIPATDKGRVLKRAAASQTESGVFKD
tara:strand:+ start:34 stop:183 length:150 start_codon:yes stop_codon:yes gene_type:complete